ncbi:hypothetical protein ACFE04_030852 [Oxalis oulophora]
MWLDERDCISVHGSYPDYGAIFMANRATMKECFKRNLFALPSGQSNFVKQIKDGMILFLFEFERRELHGVFQACSDGAMNIVPHAFTSTGKQFCAQVQVTRIWTCSPLSECEFYDAIRENYFSAKKFNFGLSQDQVHSLLSLFSLRKLRDQRPHKQISSSGASELSGYPVREMRPVDDVKYNPNTEGRGGLVFPSGSENSFDNSLSRESMFGNNADVGKLYDAQNDSDYINENAYCDYLERIDAYLDEIDQDRATSYHNVDAPYEIHPTPCRSLDPHISDIPHPSATHDAFGRYSHHQYDPDAPDFYSGNFSRSRLNDEDTASLKYRSDGRYLDQEYVPFSCDAYSEFMAKRIPKDEGYKSHYVPNSSFTSNVLQECGYIKSTEKENTFYPRSPDNRLPEFETVSEYPPGMLKSRLDFKKNQERITKVPVFEGDRLQMPNYGSSIATDRRDVRNVLSNSDDACQKKRSSVFSRLARAHEVGSQKTHASLSTNDSKMSTSVDEIMNSLEQSHHDWAKMKKSKPAITQNQNTVVGPSKLKHEKETSSSSKFSKDQSTVISKGKGEIIIPVEEIEKTQDQETPFLDFKRRSKMRKTSKDMKLGSDSGSSENDRSSIDKRMRRKLIRPVFIKDEPTPNEDVTQNVQVVSFSFPANSRRHKDMTSQNLQVPSFVLPDNSKRRKALRKAWGIENEASKPVEMSHQVGSENEQVDTTNSSKCSNEEVDRFLASLTNDIKDARKFSRHVGVQSVFGSGNNGSKLDGSPKDRNYASYLVLQETLKASEMDFENEIASDKIVCDGGRKDKLQGNSVGEAFYEEVKCNNQAFQRTVNDGVHCEIETKTAVNKSVKCSSNQCPELIGSKSGVVDAGSDNDVKLNQERLNFVSDVKFCEASGKTLSSHKMQETAQAKRDESAANGELLATKKRKSHENDFQQAFQRTVNDGVQCEIEMKTAVNKSFKVSSKQYPELIGLHSDFVDASLDDDVERNQELPSFVSDIKLCKASGKTLSSQNMQETTQTNRDENSADGELFTRKRSKAQENDFQHAFQGTVNDGVQCEIETVTGVNKSVKNSSKQYPELMGLHSDFVGASLDDDVKGNQEQLNVESDLKLSETSAQTLSSLNMLEAAQTTRDENLADEEFVATKKPKAQESDFRGTLMC